MASMIFVMVCSSVITGEKEMLLIALIMRRKLFCLYFITHEVQQKYKNHLDRTSYER